MEKLNCQNYLPPTPKGNWQSVPLKELEHSGTYQVNEYCTKLGKYAEECLYKLLVKYLIPLNDHIKIGNVQGGQDIVISVDEKIIYYIEVKSLWSDSNRVKVTNCQCHKATNNIDNYALCVMNMIGVPHDVADNEDTPMVNDLEDRISFYTDIETLMQCPKVSGKVIIPLANLNKGLSFNEFCEYMTSLL